MRLVTRVAWIAAWTIALVAGSRTAFTQDGCVADLTGDGVVNGADLANVLGNWGEVCPVNTTFVGGVVTIGGTPVPGATVTSDLGGKTISGEGGIFVLQVELPSVIEVVTLSATAEVGGVGFAGTKTVSSIESRGTNVVGLIEVSSADCDTGFGWIGASIGTPGFDVLGPRAFAIFDDGSGPQLYAGGSFTTAGGAPASNVARWDGKAWSALGSGVNGVVTALEVFDDGSGPALYVAGGFTTAGSVSVMNVARWNGTSWSAVGAGPGTPGWPGSVQSLTIFDDGSGPKLYAGGYFYMNGGQFTRGMARWNGSSWTAFFGPSTRSLQVNALAVFDSGAGPALYAAGSLVRFDGADPRGLLRWNGQEWEGVAGLTIGYGDGAPVALASGTVAGQHSLFVAGGSISIPFGGVFRFDGSNAYPLVVGVNGPVTSLVVWDDGLSTSLVVGGYFNVASTVNADQVARWDGSSWSPLGAGLNGAPEGMFAVGNSIYFGGPFTTAGGAPANRIATWGCTDP